VPCQTTFGVSLIGTSGTRFTSCCLRVIGRVVVIRMPDPGRVPGRHGAVIIDHCTWADLWGAPYSMVRVILRGEVQRLGGGGPSSARVVHAQFNDSGPCLVRGLDAVQPGEAQVRQERSRT
jgi:hypothetical protein